MDKSIKWGQLFLCLAGPVILGALSGYASVESINGWYASLIKPSFNPPNTIFGPVWTILYLLMGMSLYLILQTPATPFRKKAVLIFLIQFTLNISWSFVFFNFQSPFFALINIVILWITILLMILAFQKLSRLAAYLQIPYLAWVSFASVLNAAIWYLNQ
jgi:translocator protein